MEEKRIPYECSSTSTQRTPIWSSLRNRWRSGWIEQREMLRSIQQVTAHYENQELFHKGIAIDNWSCWKLRCRFTSSDLLRHHGLLFKATRTTYVPAPISAYFETCSITNEKNCPFRSSLQNRRLRKGLSRINTRKFLEEVSNFSFLKETVRVTFESSGIPPGRNTKVRKKIKS